MGHYKQTLNLNTALAATPIHGPWSVGSEGCWPFSDMLKNWLHAYEHWVKSNFNLC